MKLTLLSLKPETSTLPEPLTQGEIHLWFTSLTSRKEQSRENLRHVLSLYTGIDGARLEFETRGEGKPYLNAAQNSIGLSFNVSHSKELWAVAIAHGTEVGFDVERIRPVRRRAALAERFFFESERKYLEASSEKDFTFFQIWTAKEAWAKYEAQSIFNTLSRYEWKPKGYSFDRMTPQDRYVCSIRVAEGLFGRTLK